MDAVFGGVAGFGIAVYGVGMLVIVALAMWMVVISFQNAAHIRATRRDVEEIKAMLAAQAGPDEQ